MKITKPCFYCAGSGTIELSLPSVGFNYQERCPVCHNGRIAVRYADFVISLDKYKCGYCEGHGELAVGTFNTHPHCYDTATCHKCEGIGYIFPTLRKPKPDLFQMMNLEPVMFPTLHRTIPGQPLNDAHPTGSL